MKCTYCEKEKNAYKHQWWHLCKYYGLNGLFCNTCYNKVAHDSEGKPRHPVSYRNALKKLGYNVGENK